VFDDRNALADALEPLTREREIASLSVRGNDGVELYAWTSPDIGQHFPGEAWLSQAASLPAVEIPVSHQGRQIGTVTVTGSAEGLAHFLARGLASTFASLLVVAFVAWLLARRLQRSIAVPLVEIAKVAHEARVERDFSRRVPGADIAEIQSLGDDFNALLTELEAWQANVRSEQETLMHRATHDALTGLPNRAFFDLRLPDAIGQAAAAGERLAILYLDGDGFKRVNDQYGHAAGDALLIEMARRLAAALGPDDFAARLGGDEFVILLTGENAAGRAARTLQVFVEAVGPPLELPGGDYLQPGVSIGIALFPDHGDEPEALLSHADQAMYLDKERRRSGTDMPSV